MKKRNILIAALSVLMFGVTTTSCEDMLRTDSKVVMYENDNTLAGATDTVYSVMGIIKKMQVIADRTVLLGEVRGDLLEVTDHANTDLVEIANFSEISENNRYNSIVDYYAIINNCNYYLAHADTTLTINQYKVFEREYAAVLGFRAWTYLQLAQVYGKVPFVTEPITSGDQANLDNYPLMDIKQIAAELVDDLLPYSETLLPDYGELKNLLSSEFFIPVKLIIGDLYLWSEQYGKAAIYYKSYLSSFKQQVPTGTNFISWGGTDFIENDVDDSYSSHAVSSVITFIPMESQVYDGVVSELDDVFESTEDNYYFPQVTYSNAIAELSAKQIYCYHDINPNTQVSSVRYPMDDVIQESRLLAGDLRLYSNFTIRGIKLDETMGQYNDQQQYFYKYDTRSIGLYRDDQVYLRLAEAMNRAGMPETAFLVLKYGLCEENIDLYVSEKEKEYAAQNGLDTLYDFSLAYFRPAEYRYNTGLRRPTYDNSSATQNTIGIHSRGSGDAAVNGRYVLPDTTSVEFAGLDEEAKKELLIKKVEELIADEMALELGFEGYRYGDLIRIAMHRAEPGTYADNEYLASRVANRTSEYNDALYQKLYGDGFSYNRNWYLPLP